MKLLLPWDGNIILIKHSCEIYISFFGFDVLVVLSYVIYISLFDLYVFVIFFDFDFNDRNTVKMENIFIPGLCFKRKIQRYTTLIELYTF
jgi:hypothetical protein